MDVVPHRPSVSQATRVPPAPMTAVRSAILKGRLARAVADGAFVLHYQPLVELANHAITGVEALVRWDDPQLGLIPPDDFVPLAERTGLIVPLGRWVMREALAWARAWHDDTLPPVPLAVSVNVAAGQLADPGFVEDVADALDHSGFAPRLLVLEITESAVVEDLAATGSMLHRLRDLGVRVAIDDFGSGYASMSYLMRLPVDALKIDRMFVAELATGGKSEPIVHSMLRLGHTLGLQVIAEGVELEAQAQRLRLLGCEFAQGFLFSPPVPADELAAMLAAARVDELAGEAAG
jgi:EAL domain-containing protein (putative c-di-GMP-specific phosphodiesterase class I)